MTREELSDKMKDLPNPPTRVHLIQQVYDIMNEENENLMKINTEGLTELNHINADLIIENERLKKQIEWHYDEPTESKNNFYVILKNGNHRICYWDLISKADKCLKNVVNGEHIVFDFIRCWKEIELPKEIQR